MREYAATGVTQDEHEAAPTLSLSGEWHALLRGRGQARLEAALPEVLLRQRWFGGKAREIRATAIVDVASLGPQDDPALHILVVHVDYVDGEPEQYVVPVAFAEGAEAHRLIATTPTAVLAHVKGRAPMGHSGVLFDALHDQSAARLLLTTIARTRRARTQSGELIGRRHVAFGSAAVLAELEPSVLRVEQSNTSVVFGDQLLLKIVRKLEPGVSPDVEIGRYLLGKLDHVPELLGTIDYEPEGATGPRTLAVLHRFVANEGDAWVYTLDELERFAERAITDSEEIDRLFPRGRDTEFTLAQQPIPDSLHDAIGPYLGAVQLLG
jgi:trehalose synthase-fused probable maltokinase